MKRSLSGSLLGFSQLGCVGWVSLVWVIKLSMEEGKKLYLYIYIYIYIYIYTCRLVSGGSCQEQQIKKFGLDVCLHDHWNMDEKAFSFVHDNLQFFFSTIKIRNKRISAQKSIGLNCKLYNYPCFLMFKYSLSTLHQQYVL